MKVFTGYMGTKAYIAFLLILLMPFSALCKSEFRVVYQVDDQIISNYDIEQARKLHNLLSNSNLGRSKVEKIVVNEKINLPREKRKRLRAILHDIQQNGIEFALQRSSMELDQLIGHISLQMMWDRDKAQKQLTYLFEVVCKQSK